MPHRKRDLAGNRHAGSPCRHPRQSHPLHVEALLVCAWPGCGEGTARTFIQVAVERGIASSRVVQFDREFASGEGPKGFRWRASCP